MNDIDRSRDYDRDTFRSDDPDLEAYEYEGEDSGVRMPLFLIVAIVVIGAIIGTWYLAYQQGKQDALTDNGRVIASADGVRDRPEDAGGLQPPPETDLFGTQDDTSAMSRSLPREEEIIDLPSARREPVRPVDDSRTAQNGLRGAQPAGSATGSAQVPPPYGLPGSRPDTTSGATPAPTLGQPQVSGPVAVPPPSGLTTVQPGTAQPQIAQPQPTQIPPSGQVGVPAPQPSNGQFQTAPAPQTAQPQPIQPQVSQPVASAQPAVVGPQPSAAAPSAASGRFVVQLASLPSAERANQTWTNLTGRLGGLLSGYQKDVQVADLGSRGTYYRLRVGYFQSRSAAGEFCSSLKSNGQDCLVTTR